MAVNDPRRLRRGRNVGQDAADRPAPRAGPRIAEDRWPGQRQSIGYAFEWPGQCAVRRGLRSRPCELPSRHGDRPGLWRTMARHASGEERPGQGYPFRPSRDPPCVWRSRGSRPHLPFHTRERIAWLARAVDLFASQGGTGGSSEHGDPPFSLSAIRCAPACGSAVIRRLRGEPNLVAKRPGTKLKRAGPGARPGALRAWPVPPARAAARPPPDGGGARRRRSRRPRQEAPEPGRTTGPRSPA